MELEFSQDQEDLRSSARAFLAAECPPSLVRAVVEEADDAAERVHGLWRHMVDLGWPGLAIAEELGGVGLGFLEVAIVADELGRTVTPGPFTATTTQFAPALVEAGVGPHAAQWLERVVIGEVTGALAAGQATGRAGPGDLGMVARRVDGGWRLDGVERHVLDGHRADEIALAARVEEGDGVGLFVLPRDRLRTTPQATLDHSRSLATVECDDVEAPEDRVIGSPGSCGRALERALEQATVALATETVGTCSTIFDIALAHAKDRHQFGVPIGSFQAIKHKFADMLMALERARAACYLGALTIVEDAPDRACAASAAKAAAGDCQRLLAQEGIQVLGGIGYTWEHDMHLYVKRAKGGDALLGTAADHRARIADLLRV